MKYLGKYNNKDECETFIENEWKIIIDNKCEIKDELSEIKDYRKCGGSTIHITVSKEDKEDENIIAKIDVHFRHDKSFLRKKYYVHINKI